MHWYDKKWVIILFLVLLWPVGLFMMWRAPTFSTKTKGIVTGFFALLMIFTFTRDRPPKQTTQNPPAATTVKQTNQSPADETKVKETIQAVTPAQSEAPAPPPAPVENTSSSWANLPETISVLPSIGTTRTEFEKSHYITAKNSVSYIRYDKDIWHVQYFDESGNGHGKSNERAYMVTFQNIKEVNAPIINLKDLLPYDAQNLEYDNVGSDNMVRFENLEGTSEELAKIFPKSGGKFGYSFAWDARTGEFIGGTIIVEYPLPTVKK